MNIAAKTQNDYDRASLADALHRSGVTSGNTLFCHSNVGFFGRPDCELVPHAVAQLIVDAVFDVIGEDGTFVVPTFSYSFAKGQRFDPAVTPSVCGMLTEHVMKHQDACRSHHPDFSVAAIGANAERLTSEVPLHAFGPDSFFERFENANGVICNFNFDAGSTFVHYVERTINVPYRYDKKFFGDIVINGFATPSHSIGYVHDLTNPLHVAAFEPFHNKAVETGIANVVPLGRGNVCTLRARDVRRMIEETIQNQPFFLTVAHELNEKQTITPSHDLTETDTAILQKWRSTPERNQIAKALNALNRAGVTSGTNGVFEILSGLLPVSVYDIPTGTSLSETIVPERWTLESASITSSDDTQLLNQNNQAVAVHSRNFSGEISGIELRAHVFEHDRGERLAKGQWAVRLNALQAEIDPEQMYHVDIKVKNTFSALSYAIMPSVAPMVKDPVFIDLSQDAETLEDMIIKLADGSEASQCTVLFYVQPFDPAAIYEYHQQNNGAALNS